MSHKGTLIVVVIYLKTIVGDEGVPVDGEDVRVASPDPGDGFVAELFNFARKICVGSQLRRYVRGRRGIEIWPRV